ncbi:MAG: hypothetical protein F6K44_18295 [Moorea sp. SIO3E2]|nr:hypothetical protein [Moorena sp. SIO3E2]
MFILLLSWLNASDDLLPFSLLYYLQKLPIFDIAHCPWAHATGTADATETEVDYSRERCQGKRKNQ